VISRRRFLTAGAIALAPLGAAAHAQQYKAQQAVVMGRHPRLPAELPENAEISPVPLAR
jgi:hypothetical protein